MTIRPIVRLAPVLIGALLAACAATPSPQADSSAPQTSQNGVEVTLDGEPAFIDLSDGAHGTVETIDGIKVVHDLDAFTPTQIRVIEGDDLDDADPPSQGCVAEAAALRQDLKLQRELRKGGLAIESLDLTVVGDQRRLERCQAARSPAL